jgi:hypothetical protein
MLPLLDEKSLASECLAKVSIRMPTLDMYRTSHDNIELLVLFILEQLLGRGPRTDTITFVWPHSTRAEPVD